MTRGAPELKGVMVDALGTMVELEPPWEHLAPVLGAEADAEFIEAYSNEMRFYREHAHEGRDEASVAELRRRCAGVLSDELGQTVSVEQMLDSIRFRAYPDVVPALTALREQGLRVVCVSNWDVSLAEVLERCKLDQLFDGVVTSASAGAAKPDPAPFLEALELLGCSANEALHVGDSPADDIEGAEAAGIRAVLISRYGGGEISSLAELPAIIGG